VERLASRVRALRDYGAYGSDDSPTRLADRDHLIHG